MHNLLPTWTLLWREIIRFYRQRSRIIGALATPLVFWLLIGSGLGRSFHSSTLQSDKGYLEYFFPGMIVMVLLFTAIYSTISIIEDRREGFLQAVLVAPVSRSSIVLGKVLGATTLALVQALLLTTFAPMAGLQVGLYEILGLVMTYALLGFVMSSLGFLVAWRLSSVQGFHAIMNLLLLPMWMLSGAVFPATGAPAWMGWIMTFNPLTYGVAMIQHLLYPGRAALETTIPEFQTSLIVMIVFVVVLHVLNVVQVRTKTAVG